MTARADNPTARLRYQEAVRRWKDANRPGYGDRHVLAGDDNGNVALAGTDLVMARVSATDRPILVLNATGRTLGLGEALEVLPMGERSPAGWYVPGKPPLPVLYATIQVTASAWAPGDTIADSAGFFEFWQIEPSAGTLTPVGAFENLPLAVIDSAKPNFDAPNTWTTEQPGAIPVDHTQNSRTFATRDGWLAGRRMGSTLDVLWRVSPTGTWSSEDYSALLTNDGLYWDAGTWLDIGYDGYVYVLMGEALRSDALIAAITGIPEPSGGEPAPQHIINNSTVWTAYVLRALLTGGSVEMVSELFVIDIGSPATPEFNARHTTPYRMFSAGPRSQNQVILALDGDPSLIGSYARTFQVYLGNVTTTWSVSYGTDGSGFNYPILDRSTPIKIGNGLFSQTHTGTDSWLTHNYLSYVAWSTASAFYFLRSDAVYKCVGDALQSGNWSTVFTLPDQTSPPTYLPTLLGNGLTVAGFGDDFYLGRFSTPGTGANPHGAVYYYGPASPAGGQQFWTLWRYKQDPANPGGTGLKSAIITIAVSNTTGTVRCLQTHQGEVCFLFGYPGGEEAGTYLPAGIHAYAPGSGTVRQIAGLPSGWDGPGWYQLWGDGDALL